MSTLDPGMPRKVLRWAHDHGGVHNDCLAAGDPCEDCKNVVMLAFDHFYGHSADIGEVLAAIIEDFRKDHLEDELGKVHD